MRIVRLLHAKRMVLCLGLLGLLALSGGCSDNLNAPPPPATAEQKERTDKMRDARAKAVGPGGKRIVEKVQKKG